MTNRFATLSDEEKRMLFSRASEQTKLAAQVIEKDWWVTIVLQLLSQSSCADYLSFKGGTSLSKAWGLIERFSEDADLALDHTFFGIDNTNRSQRLKLRKTSRQFITEPLSSELNNALQNLGCSGYTVEPVTKVNDKELDGDKDPTVILVKYKSLYPSLLTYLQPAVRIEISCLSMKEPIAPRDISSLVSQCVPALEQDDTFVMNTVMPTRTFLEKAFLLNEEYQRDFPRSFRMSRHLYDLERMMDTEYGMTALTDKTLYQSIVQHRREYYCLKYVDYDSNNPDRIIICPPDNLLSDWRADYESMRNSFIYGRSQPFDDLIERIMSLQERFRKL